MSEADPPRSRKTPRGRVPRGPATASTFPIVGIGASAGGLAAFEAFISGMTAGSGLALVLVQHLDPAHKSLLPELVRRHTSLEVFEVSDGIEVRPDCVYIIPPNHNLALSNGALKLMDPSRGPRLPIDFFFESLARERRDRAIGVVLSGTGRDGTLGARAIKREGGFVLAQAPETAEHDGMPRGVIDAKLADDVLPPARMPGRIRLHVPGAPAAASGPRPAESPIGTIFRLLRTHTGHDFSRYKRNTVGRRIDRRMAALKIDGLPEYARHLEENPAEVRALFDDLLIGVTTFFRDPKGFDALHEQVLLRVFADRPPGSMIRVWVPGCSTGEEAYSIAILLQERMESLKQGFKIQIFATDLDPRAIQKARAGVYPATIRANVSAERLSRFFTLDPENNSYRIAKSLRDLLVFSEQDVTRDPPFSKVDLISCRNLLIYMAKELQTKLIPLFHYALNPGGLLFLGSSETVGDFPDLFAVLDAKSKLYQRKEIVHALFRAPLHKPGYSPSGGGPAARLPPGTPDSPPPPLRELTERALLQQLSAVGALVDEHGDILYLHGRTDPYLEPAPGESRMNILRMAREGLQGELTTALHQAVNAKKPVRRPDLRVSSRGGDSHVHLTVRPVATRLPGDPALYLVVFEEAPPPDRPSGGARGAGRGRRPRLAVEAGTHGPGGTPPGHARGIGNLHRGAPLLQRGDAVRERGTAIDQRGAGDLQGRVAVGQRGTGHAECRTRSEGDRPVESQQRLEQPDGRHGHRDDLRGPRPADPALHPRRHPGHQPHPGRRGPSGGSRGHQPGPLRPPRRGHAGRPGHAGPLRGRGPDPDRRLVPPADPSLPHPGKRDRGRRDHLRRHHRDETGPGRAAGGRRRPPPRRGGEGCVRRHRGPGHGRPHPGVEPARRNPLRLERGRGAEDERPRPHPQGAARGGDGPDRRAGPLPVAQALPHPSDRQGRPHRRGVADGHRARETGRHPLRRLHHGERGPRSPAEERPVDEGQAVIPSKGESRDPGDRPDGGARELRRRAEESARRTAPEMPENRSPLSPEDAKRLLYELRVHQFELEMQNDELRRTQQELEASRSRYSDLYDLAPAGYLTLAEDGIIREANLTAARMFGVERGSLIGKPLTGLILPEDQDVFYLYRKRGAKPDAPRDCELRMRHAAASPFWVRFEGTWGTEADGSPVCRLAMTDVTVRKTAEASLLTVQRLESLGILAGGIAHDFNNLLTAILGNLSLLQTDLGREGRVQDYVQEALRACEAAKGLARQLLTFAKGGSPVVDVLDVRLVLRQAAGLAVRGSSTRCALDLPDQPLLASLDPSQIYQAIQNLALNAVQAMPQGGEISVGARTVQLGAGEIPPLDAGPYIRVEIRDQGCGISPELLPRIFDPYFSTKAQGRGLGLAITHSIVAKHGGHIAVESKVGAGTTFTLHLPLTASEASVPASTPRAITPGTGRILIMEDEVVVAKVLKGMLERLGYEASIVGDGRSAIEAYRRQAELKAPFDAAVMDLVIQAGMGGKETIVELLALFPDAKVILSSGYSSDPIMSDWAAHGFSGVLEKPYHLEDVSEALSRILRPPQRA